MNAGTYGNRLAVHHKTAVRYLPTFHRCNVLSSVQCLAMARHPVFTSKYYWHSELANYTNGQTFMKLPSITL
ncbi:hypothetical protein PISMIDRAFT_144471 [Pisolithus microcarpus 441]|uniref:Uncharacterized protein n=1 Tax=Pisolithus microcarpus 441 TaxID=765257 RepID=A0A0C9YSA7_9AGAM|nr:hypothetical protein PISMIDRAFT_144471 [Pisolithus microcarpus 441]